MVTSDTETTMANTNFVGDFEAEWLVNRSGDIRLKAYNETNEPLLHKDQSDNARHRYHFQEGLQPMERAYVLE